MVKFSIVATALALSLTQSAAFAPNTRNNIQPTTTELRMSNDDVTKTVGSSMVAASLFFSAAFTPADAFAVEQSAFDFGPSSELIAAKSGGRAGGRSSASTMRSSAPPSRPPSQSTTTINRTTVIQAPAAPVVVAPPPVVVGGGFGYGYNPLMPSPLGKLVHHVSFTKSSRHLQSSCIISQ